MSGYHLAKPLHHKNLMGVLATCTVDDQDYIISEWVEGEDAYALMVQGSFKKESTMRKTANAWVRGLSAMHAENVAHGDVKLGNLMVTKWTKTVKVIDYDTATNKEHTSMMCNDPRYMGPEALMGEAFDPKLADVWAVGACILLLTDNYKHSWPNADEPRSTALWKDKSQPDRADWLHEHYDISRELAEVLAGVFVSAAERVSMAQLEAGLRKVGQFHSESKDRRDMDIVARKEAMVEPEAPVCVRAGGGSNSTVAANRFLSRARWTSGSGY